MHLLKDKVKTKPKPNKNKVANTKKEKEKNKKHFPTNNLTTIKVYYAKGQLCSMDCFIF